MRPYCKRAKSQGLWEASRNWLIASKKKKKKKSQSYNLIDLNSVKNHKSLKDDPELQKEINPAGPLVAILWNPEQRI